MTHSQVEEVVRDFVATQRSYAEECAPEGVFVRDPELAAELGVRHAPHCAIVFGGGGEVSLLASAGPDPLGHWNGVDEEGRVHQWLADELAEW